MPQSSTSTSKNAVKNKNVRQRKSSKPPIAHIQLTRPLCCFIGRLESSPFDAVLAAASMDEGVRGDSDNDYSASSKLQSPSTPTTTSSSSSTTPQRHHLPKRLTRSKQAQIDRESQEEGKEINNKAAPPQQPETIPPQSNLTHHAHPNTDKIAITRTQNNNLHVSQNHIRIAPSSAPNTAASDNSSSLLAKPPATRIAQKRSNPSTHNSCSNTPHTHPPQPSQGSDEKKSKQEKGLRHFSARVCAKVEERGCTTYNEVAEDLVQEITKETGRSDQKNIRRRVYDALNVLMAIDVISKDKKDIKWLGLPNEATSEIRGLEEAIVAKQRRIAEKKKNVVEMVQRYAALKNLIIRNRQSIVGAGENTIAPSRAGDNLKLPFILVNAPRDCKVHCEMLEDRSQYFFEFDSPFLINEDIELLRLMGLDRTEYANLHSWLPLDLVKFYYEATSGGRRRNDRYNKGNYNDVDDNASSSHNYSRSTRNHRHSTNNNSNNSNNDDDATQNDHGNWPWNGADEYLESMPVLLGTSHAFYSDHHHIASNAFYPKTASSPIHNKKY